MKQHQNHTQIIKELESGNLNFSLKEILIATIQQNREEHAQINTRLNEGHKTFVSKNIATKGFSLLLCLIGALASYVIYGGGN